MERFMIELKSIGKFHKVHFANGWFGANSVSNVDGINVKQNNKDS